MLFLDIILFNFLYSPNQLWVFYKGNELTAEAQGCFLIYLRLGVITLKNTIEVGAVLEITFRLIVYIGMSICS